MLPSIRHRLIIGTAVVMGACCWLLVAGLLTTADGSSGLALTSTRVGWVVAVGLVAVAGIPVMALGLLTSVTGHPVAGIFAVATALAVLAGVGGSTEGWLRRAAVPGGYGWLIFESLLWQAGMVFMLTLIQRLRSPLRTRWPALAFQDHLGVDTHLWLPTTQALLAGALCAAVSGVACYFLLLNTSSGQVLCGLTIAFMLGGLIAYTAFPQVNLVGILSSPFIVAIGAYLYVLMRYDDTDSFLRAWFDQSLPGLALALPIHYASAGLAGCTLGVGLAENFNDSMTTGQVD